MTEEELRLELLCYKEYINPDCDIDNMTIEEKRDFYKHYVQCEKMCRDAKDNLNI